MPEPNTPEEPTAADSSIRRWPDVLAALACLLVSTALAVAPHLAMLARHGTLEYLADGDDVLYLTISRIPYHGETSLRDPFARPGESSPTLYAWCQFVPIAWLTHALGLPPILTNLVWRTLGGILLGLTIYVAFRRLLGFLTHPTAWALGLSLVCLADPGFSGGRMFVGEVSLVRQLLQGQTISHRPETFSQYRVVTPLLNLPFLLLVVASLVPTPRGRYWILPGAIGLGLCMQLYFFLWTAALPALGMVFLTSLLEGYLRPERRPAAWTRARAVALVLVGGMILGAPQVYSNARSFADPAFKPILQRLSRGWVVPPDSPHRTEYLRNTWFWGKFALASLAIAAFRLRNAQLPWWLALFGFALANSAIVTRLEFENYHWSYVYSPFSAILVLVCLAQLLERAAASNPRRLFPLAAIPVAMIAVAGAYRPFEALHAKEAVENRRRLEELDDLRPSLATLTPDNLLAGPFEANIALLLGRSGILYQTSHTSHSTLIPDREVHERHALNAWLQGMSPEHYAEQCAGIRFQVGPDGLPEWAPGAVAAARTAIFRSIGTDGGKALLARYRPDILLLPGAWETPPRGGPWSLLQRGRHWSLWKAR